MVGGKITKQRLKKYVLPGKTDKIRTIWISKDLMWCLVIFHPEVL